VAKKPSRGKSTSKKSARKADKVRTPERLIVEVDLDTRFSPPHYLGSWKVTRVIYKRGR
jgi:hypothetical protein